MAEQTETETETSLPPERVAEMARAGEAVLVDVRRAYEWEAGRIEGARHVEMNELTRSADTIARDRPVVFYCRSGNRSGMAAEAFRQAGYDAHNMDGGLSAWAERGLPLEPADGNVAGPRPEP